MTDIPRRRAPCPPLPEQHPQRRYPVRPGCPAQGGGGGAVGKVQAAVDGPAFVDPVQAACTEDSARADRAYNRCRVHAGAVGPERAVAQPQRHASGVDFGLHDDRARTACLKLAAC
jgi:hypothetical protein